MYIYIYIYIGRHLHSSVVPTLHIRCVYILYIKMEAEINLCGMRRDN